MPDTEFTGKTRRAMLLRQHGGHAVEFVIVVLVFLAFVFGIIEMARSMYVLNTLQEVTRRAAQAAATANVGSAEVMRRIRADAVFRQTAGALALGDPVSDDYVRIDFLALVADASGSMSMEPVAGAPACPVQNRLNCLNNPNGTSCIRFVRARICVPGAADTCERATYQTVLPLVPFRFQLPRSTTIVPVESLGYWPGARLCPG